MILGSGYLHIYGAEEGEVKDHVGVKRSGGIWSCAPHLGCPVVRLYVCDTLVKVFVWNMLFSLFLHQFCLNLVEMILGYLHIYGAEEGEVKGHVGVKRSGGIWSCAPHLGCPVVRLYVCDTLVKDFVWNMLFSLFLHQFCLNLVEIILGYLHIYGADKGEVKGHVGAKGQVEYGHMHHFWVKVFVWNVLSKKKNSAPLWCHLFLWSITYICVIVIFRAFPSKCMIVSNDCISLKHHFTNSSLTYTSSTDRPICLSA